MKVIEIRKKKWLCGIFLLAAAVWLFYGLVIKNPQVRECSPQEGQLCQVSYLLNLDGMKGLGHSALILVDESGEGQLLSYNGMQYNLLQCLLGKRGIGKMKQFSLDARAVNTLLETGDLQAEEFEECDNFDRALYRYISREQYDMIMAKAEEYIETGEKYEQLYVGLHEAVGDVIFDAQEQMERFLSQEDIPRYQIYNHNCDTVARELIASVDEEMEHYNRSREKLTPGGNYRNLCRALSDTWGYRKLGEDSLVEKLLDL